MPQLTNDEVKEENARHISRMRQEAEVQNMTPEQQRANWQTNWNTFATLATEFRSFDIFAGYMASLARKEQVRFGRAC